MILADTSVIIDIWKNPNQKNKEIFENNDIATCYVVKSELIHGAKSEREKKKISTALNELFFVDIDDEVWEYLGEILYTLRKGGLTVPFQDALIASLCIKKDCRLWSLDKHFERMADILEELTLFHPS